MKSQKHDIDDVFASKFKDFEVEVPDSVWSNISAGLSDLDRRSRSSLQKKRIALWGVASVAASLLLFFLFLPDPKIEKLPQARVPHAKVEDMPHGRSKPDLNLSAQSAALSPAPRVVSMVSSSSTLSVANNLPEQHPSSSEERVGVVAISTGSSPSPISDNPVRDTGGSSVSGENDPELERKTEQFRRAAEQEADRIFAQAEQKDKVNSRHLSLSFGGGVGLASESKTANRLLTLSGSSRMSSSQYNDYMQLLPSAISSSKSEYELQHSLPISFSLGVAKPLTDYLDLEVGISYSYLHSEQKGTANTTMKQVQQFSYIGLPVALNFRFATWDRFRFGFLVGGNIQKDISGRLKEQVNGSQMYQDNSSKSIHQKYIQPSFNANIHVSYRLVGGMQMFGKLGGAYYFKMDNNYNTIYSDKNFLPDVGIGFSYRIDY
jgi:hypothetical protein